MSKNRKVTSTSAARGSDESSGDDRPVVKRRSSGGGGGDDRRAEVAGVIGLGAGLFLLIAMVSLQAGTLVMGPFGRAIAGMFYGLAGVCGYALIALGVTAAIRVLLGKQPVLPPVVKLPPWRARTEAECQRERAATA